MEGSRGNASGGVAITSDALSVANEAGNIGLMPAIFGISRQICANTASVFSGEFARLTAHVCHHTNLIANAMAALAVLLLDRVSLEFRIQGSGFEFWV